MRIGIRSTIGLLLRSQVHSYGVHPIVYPIPDARINLLDTYTRRIQGIYDCFVSPASQPSHLQLYFHKSTFPLTFVFHAYIISINKH